ncbi:MAG: proprotein convertase P-domain-containing protein [Candidatus Riflebacteria bacterium]|nr:proprotein convertase P-domain-containing protein [Candidatus Riflebacteria bacterium]
MGADDRRQRGRKALQLALAPAGDVLVLTSKGLRRCPAVGPPISAPLDLGTTNAVVFPMGGRRYLPVGGAMAAAGNLVLVSPGMNAPFIARIRADTGEVTRIPTPRGTTSIAITPDGATAIATHLTDGVATIVDLATGATTTLDVGFYPLKALAPQQGLAIIANFLSDDLTLFDPARPGDAIQVPVGVEPVDLATGAGGGRSFVATADSGSDTITFVDLGTGQVAARYQSAFNVPCRLAVGRNGRRLAAALFASSRVPLLDFQLFTGPQNRVTLEPADLSAGALGQPYQPPGGGGRIRSQGGTGPFGFAVINGREPAPGLTIGTDGTIQGTPTQVGVFRFTAMATDQATGEDAIGRYSLQVLPPSGTVLGWITNDSLPPGEVGTDYPETTIGAAGLSSPVTWRLEQAPAWLSIDTSGTVRGHPTAAGDFPVTVTARDPAGGLATRSYVVPVRTVARARGSANPNVSIPDGSGEIVSTINLSEVGQAVLADVTVNVTHPYAGDLTLVLIPPTGDQVLLRAADGAPGTDLNATFHGVPLPQAANLAGPWRLQMKDVVLGDRGTLGSWSIEVESAFSIGLDGVPPGQLNVPYSARMRILGGAPPLEDPTVVSGVLPPGLVLGLSLDRTRVVLDGSPTQAGPFQPTISVRNSTGAAATTALDLPVVAVASSGASPIPTRVTEYRLWLANPTSDVTARLVMAVHPAGSKVYVHAPGAPGGMDDYLHVLDVQTATLSSFPTFTGPGTVSADQPMGLAVSADGRFLYQAFEPTLQGGVVQPTVRKIRTSDRSVVFQRVSVDQGYRRLALRPDQSLLVSSRRTNASAHDPVTGASDDLAGFGEPDWLTSSGENRYFLFPPGEGGGGIPLLAWDTTAPPGSSIYSIASVPRAFGTAVRYIPSTGFRYVYLNVASGWTAPGGSIKRLRFLTSNPPGSTLATTVTYLNLYPGHLALTPDFKYLYAPRAVPLPGGGFSGGLVIFDLANPANQWTVELGAPAFGIAVSPDNRRVFVTVPSLQKLFVLEPAVGP